MGYILSFLSDILYHSLHILPAENGKFYGKPAGYFLQKAKMTIDWRPPCQMPLEPHESQHAYRHLMSH